VPSGKDRIADMVSLRALECLVTVVEQGSLTMTAWLLVPVLRSWRRRFPDVELDLPLAMGRTPAVSLR
jgi:DNA-binding transcriptional LysR family regulator